MVDQLERSNSRVGVDTWHRRTVGSVGKVFFLYMMWAQNTVQVMYVDENCTGLNSVLLI